MADCPAADVRLSDRSHLNRGHDSSDHTSPLEGIHQSHCIHYGAQHSHVIRSGSFHAPLNTFPSSPEIACADYDGNFNALGLDFDDLAGNHFGLFGVNSKSRGAG
jgi:hypothetical protein